MEPNADVSARGCVRYTVVAWRTRLLWSGPALEQSVSREGVPRTRVYMGRRFSMLSMFESVELRGGPLSVTRSLMRIPGRPDGCDVGGGVGPSARGGNVCNAPLDCGGAG